MMDCIERPVNRLTVDALKCDQIIAILVPYDAIKIRLI